MPRPPAPLLLLALVVAIGACAKQRPPAVVAMEPRPNPPTFRQQTADTPRERLRQNRWLAQFWEELTPAQRRRVEARMRRAQPSTAPDGESVGSTWDTLGLAERDRLVFGGSAPARPAAAAGRAPSTEGAEATAGEAPPATP